MSDGTRGLAMGRGGQLGFWVCRPSSSRGVLQWSLSGGRGKTPWSFDGKIHLCIMEREKKCKKDNY